MRITITAKQLRIALEFLNPDGPDDADQMATELTIAHCEARISDEGEPMPAGLYAWFNDYPEEGCIPLFDEPDGSMVGS